MAKAAVELQQMDKVILSVVLYAILAKLSDVIVSWLEKRLLQWRIV